MTPIEFYNSDSWKAERMLAPDKLTQFDFAKRYHDNEMNAVREDLYHISTLHLLIRVAKEAQHVLYEYGDAGESNVCAQLSEALRVAIQGVHPKISTTPFSPEKHLGEGWQRGSSEQNCMIHRDGWSLWTHGEGGWWLNDSRGNRAYAGPLNPLLWRALCEALKIENHGR